MMRNIAFVLLCLIVGTLGGASIASGLSAFVLFVFLDASWQWAIGIGSYGAIPGGIIGWISGMFFGLFRMDRSRS
jgi:hypothetical protein